MLVTNFHRSSLLEVASPQAIAGETGAIGQMLAVVASAGAAIIIADRKSTKATKTLATQVLGVSLSFVLKPLFEALVVIAPSCHS